MSTWAAIFDWDGVVLDSSAAHERAWERLAAEEGRSLFPGFFRQSFGMKNDRVIQELLGWTRDPAQTERLNLRKEELFREEIRRSPVQLLPGVRTFLKALRGWGVRCAVGSSTPRANIECVLEPLGLGEFFEVIVTGEDVQRGKPDPEVFLRAAERLQLPPWRCVVFEDAPVGIEAARRAGMKVVGVAGTHPAEALQGCHRVVHRLDELDVVELGRWFADGPPAER
jgi:beta-phosphoglucomutase family hydrolase